MADLLDLDDSSPLPPPKSQDAEAPQDNFLSGFDPLSDGAAQEAPRACAQGLGMPEEVTKAFEAAGDSGTAAPQQPQELLPSGLSVEGQAVLMRQIEESAKKMSLGGAGGSDTRTKRPQDSFAAFDDLAKAGA